MFDRTRQCAGQSDMCNTVYQVFGIDWNHVSWSDLLKPLYSGLAAALYIQVMDIHVYLFFIYTKHAH